MLPEKKGGGADEDEAHENGYGSPLHPSLGTELLAGSFAGAASTSILHPFDLIKTRLQVQLGHGTAPLRNGSAFVNNTRYYSGTINAFWTVVRKEGPVALYQGLKPNAVAAGLSWGYFFLLYSFFKSRIRARFGYGEHEHLGAVSHMFAATAAGMTTSLLTNPLWVVKTRMQLQLNQEAGAYRGVISALRDIYVEEGIRGWYRGMIPALFGTTHGAVQFVCYEKLKHVFSEAKGGMANLSHFDFFLASTSSKIAATVVTYPYQVIKSRLQEKPQKGSNQTQYKYTGITDASTKLWRSEGIYGFYKGLVPNLLRVVPASALTLIIYEEILRLSRRKKTI